MANTFLLRIVTPGNDVFEGNVKKVFLKNGFGNLEILANHENMITSTVPHIARIVDDNGSEKKVFISTAVVEINDGKLVICSDAAEFAQDIDFVRAEAAKNRAEQRLKSGNKFKNHEDKLSYLRAIERLKLKN